MRNTKEGLIEDYAANFHQEAHGSKLSKRWLAQLSENPVDCVCGQSFLAKQEYFFQRCFLETIFSPEGDTLKSYKSKGICSIALKFWQ